LGQLAAEEIERIRIKHPDKIVGSRGLGLLFGIELAFNGTEVWKRLLAKRIICNLTQGTILRLVPPLTIEEDDIRTFANELDNILGEVDAS